MTDSLEDTLGRFADGCPTCGEEPSEAQVRGPEVVLVPCGHAIDASHVTGFTEPAEFGPD